jgi:enamine deaminase RidA (YjgF/YER057c/UK114 family)
MNYLIKNFENEGVEVKISNLEIPHKTKDYHIIFYVVSLNRTFEEQWKSLFKVLKNVIDDPSCLNMKSNAIPVFSRCFLTDIANQKEKVLNLSSLLNCEISFIEQPLLDGSKLALWVNMQTDAMVENDGIIGFDRNGYSHYYTIERFNQIDRNPKVNVYNQTISLLESYENKLKEKNCTIAQNCLRTWFFVRDIDANYQDVARARREKFQEIGLRSDTHYIASTGIEGRSEYACEKVMLDTYAIKGLNNEQVRFLQAKQYLCPTHKYGVTFERGVMIDFGDRRNVYISGTASIDKEGRVVHEGNIKLQCIKMMENVDALLHEAECSFNDILLVVIYLRDIADYNYVKSFFDAKLTETLKLILLAPICRPKWVIEMECIASKKLLNSKFRDF